MSQNGKGSKNRSKMDQNYRSNYDEIKWSKSTQSLPEPDRKTETHDTSEAVSTSSEN